MKTMRLFLAVSIIVSAIILSVGCTKQSVDTTKSTDLTLSGFGSAGALADEDLTLEKMMNYAMQDEYAARAEYEAIMKEYGEQSPFDNIMQAEETHIASLTALFETYGYSVPEDTSAEHVVLPASLKEAYQTGVDAEIANIAMYEKFLSYDIPKDAAQVFTSLMKASQNHLKAFRSHL